MKKGIVVNNLRFTTLLLIIIIGTYGTALMITPDTLEFTNGNKNNQQQDKFQNVVTNAESKRSNSLKDQQLRISSTNLQIQHLKPLTKEQITTQWTTVASPLTIGSFTVNGHSSSQVYVDQYTDAVFNVSASGGTTPYTFFWELPNGCSSSNTSKIICYPNTIGSSIVNVTVTDFLGTSVTSSNILVTIFTQILVPKPTASQSSVDVSQTVVFSDSATGGNGVYSYLWYFLPTGCGSYNASSISCTPSESGTFAVHLDVTDTNNGFGASGGLYFPVYNLPTVTSPISSRPNGTIGTSVTFTTTSSGGSGSLTYSWSSSSSSFVCSSSNTDTITCTPQATGDFTVTVNVTDSNGGTVIATSQSYHVYTLPTSKTATTTLNMTTTSLSTNSNRTSLSKSKASPSFTYFLTLLTLISVATVVSFKRRVRKN